MASKKIFLKILNSYTKREEISMQPAGEKNYEQSK